jgi:Zn-dependent peptidase ImmA (M78 family)
MTRVEVKPALLRWARHRARLGPAALAKRFPKLEAWEAGTAQPTLKQLEEFARATFTPVGYLFLAEPPVESVPIPDFRTVASVRVSTPSANLLDTIYVCQQRQEWYRDFARSSAESPLQFVGSVNVGSDVVATAAAIRAILGFNLEERRQLSTWEDALRLFIARADDAGILVMCSGIVLNNTHRKLDPDEFRGFAIADSLAPVIFINGADTKSAQMFTLAHELVHVWLGQSALSNAQPRQLSDGTIEQWCNAVAAEMLVPIATMREAFDPRAEVSGEMARLARRFKVSTLVILRRIHDIGGLTRDAFWALYDAEVRRLRALRREGGGGQFHLTEAVRVSKRFARAIVASTLEGQTLYRDAFRMLGFSKMDTFLEFGRTVGVAV